MVLQRIFSRRVSYAVHALCLLAHRQPLAAVPVSDLAWQMAQAWPSASATYLSKVVQALVQGGILVSLRGSAGGYGFSRPPAELSFLDVVCAIEGPLDASCPLKPSGPCTLKARCTNYDTLLQLQNYVAHLLAQITIERLAHDLPKLGSDAGRDTVKPCLAAFPLVTSQLAIFPPTSPNSLRSSPTCSNVKS